MTATELLARYMDESVYDADPIYAANVRALADHIRRLPPDHEHATALYRRCCFDWDGKRSMPQPSTAPLAQLAPAA